MKDDLLITISTENGTGSQTANKILNRSIILAGFHTSSKNLFPSNIAGLPTQYRIRVSSHGFSSFSKNDKSDIAVFFNQKTLEKDTALLDENSLVIINDDFKTKPEHKHTFGLACRSLTRELYPSANTRKLLYNMLYVGAVIKSLNIDLGHAIKASNNVLSHLKEDLKNANIDALKIGYETYDLDQSYSLNSPEAKPDLSIIDGNSAMALGFLDGGAQVFTWYPITPSSSVAENFESFNKSLGAKRAILQCEDELSAVTASLGAGWAGAKSLTATSGPGISLMQESIGLGYFTETPFVIADVQRAGPSTGLPTRTSQGDLTLSYYSSHGDTLHPVLLPSNPQQVYSDSYNSLSLAQDLQTPVFVLSDLDLGMNEWSTPTFKQEANDHSSGEIQKDKADDFKRFSNDQLVSKRSLPRLSDVSTAYFTRGSGHDEYGRYTEDPDIFEQKLLRLKKKVLEGRTVSKFFPKDIVDRKASNISLIYYGTTSQIIDELLFLLKDHSPSTYQVRALPIDPKMNDFLKDHELNFVLEQNRDGQLSSIIKSQIKDSSNILTSTQYNGLPADPKNFYSKIMEVLK